MAFLPTKTIQAVAKDSSGASAMVVALGMTVIVGFLGLGSEVGLWYYTHRSMLAAADSGAISAANAIAAGSLGAFASEAKTAAAQYGYVDGTNNVSVAVSNPPSNGTYAGNTSAVEVVVQKTQPALFSALFLGKNISLAASSVALVAVSGNDCLLALDPTASSAASSNGTTNINLVGCGMAIDSSNSSALSLVGGAEIAADSAAIVGNYSVSSNSSFSTVNGTKTGSATVPDPYRNVALPAFSGCDYNNDMVKGTKTLSPGVYCNGISVNANANVTLNPGTYFIDRGSLSVAGGATITGSDVTIVLTNSTGGAPATVSISGGATVNITPPSSGPLAGMAFFQDRTGSASTNNDFTGGTTQSITGAIYFPTETVNFAGGTKTGKGCTQIIADKINFKGNAVLEINCTGIGTKPIGSSPTKLVQ